MSPKESKEEGSAKTPPLGNSPDMTWKNVVKDALLQLGRKARLHDINEIVRHHPKTRTNPTWGATIRRVVRQYKIFKPVPPARSGIYELIDETPLRPETQDFEKKPEVNHGIAQGMLITLGKIYGYETYVPPHDQTVREFQGIPLSEHVSVKICPEFVKGPNFRKVREIDALWLDEDDDGLYPVYAFEVEESTKVKSGLDRLLKIPRRLMLPLYIIGPGAEEKELFNKYVRQAPFSDHSSRFVFRVYDELARLYNNAVKHNSSRTSFGLKERWNRER